MRKKYRYNTIRFYPSIRSDEFFNVGVFVKSESGETKTLYLDNDEYLKALFEYTNIKISDYKHYLKKLKEEEETEFKFHYGHYLRLRGDKLMFSSDNIEQVTKDLFFDYVEYKFKKETN